MILFFQKWQQEEKRLLNREAEEPVIIKVDVKGAVRTPGVYIAQPGDRVIDLIAAAGDFTKNADLDKVNLAQLVEDQMVIYVPRVGEEEVEVAGTLQRTGTGANVTESATSSNKVK